MDLEDVTEAFPAIAAKARAAGRSDRVYKVAGKDGAGFLAKVRVRPVAAPDGEPGFGLRVYEISAAEVDAKGRAVPHGEGFRIAPPHRHTAQSDEGHDVAAALEAQRQAAVERLAHARALELQHAQLFTA